MNNYRYQNLMIYTEKLYTNVHNIISIQLSQKKIGSIKIINNSLNMKIS